MTKTTRAQRETLFRKWKQVRASKMTPLGSMEGQTYRQFRRSVQPTICMDDAIAAPWCGMWLCIEKDGYCHT